MRAASLKMRAASLKMRAASQKMRAASLKMRAASLKMPIRQNDVNADRVSLRSSPSYVNSCYSILIGPCTGQQPHRKSFV